jgi:hypothetical protein
MECVNRRRLSQQSCDPRLLKILFYFLNYRITSVWVGFCRLSKISVSIRSHCWVIKGKQNQIGGCCFLFFPFFFFFSLSVFSLSCYEIKLYIHGQFGKDFEGILCNFSGFLNFSDNDFIGAGLSGMGYSHHRSYKKTIPNCKFIRGWYFGPIS